MSEHPLLAAGHRASDQPVEIRRVGPGGEMASDNAFALALLNLWHSVSEAGGAVGFTPPVDRVAVGGAVATVIEDLRSGRVRAVAAVRGRDVIGFASIRPGRQTQSHTGSITQVMVSPGSQGTGIGRRLVEAVLELAAEMTLERVQLRVRDGVGLAEFYGRFGFREVGRLPNWIRVAPGDDRDEVLLVKEF
ncbi:Ribosomal protein S18 acetylase RimI [Nakamurella panacisegetis]|uniref:Ribosomal protein S18 acetylase RimI n=1 Tax=Nakamurella panacisegetis TaxID=1090615 RepID=A0A1H0HWD3_9ACTN|nr:GNAT family N-acetyltransferase [Nakamurella panacisegetis]SDO23071.1 Ribosomal protein S18 acetylase RimI [Nakamurella panacisegetis]